MAFEPWSGLFLIPLSSAWPVFLIPYSVPAHFCIVDILFQVKTTKIWGSLFFTRPPLVWQKLFPRDRKDENTRASSALVTPWSKGGDFLLGETIWKHKTLPHLSSTLLLKHMSHLGDIWATVPTTSSGAMAQKFCPGEGADCKNRECQAFSKQTRFIGTNCGEVQPFWFSWKKWILW